MNICYCMPLSPPPTTRKRWKKTSNVTIPWKQMPPIPETKSNPFTQNLRLFPFEIVTEDHPSLAGRALCIFTPTTCLSFISMFFGFHLTFLPGGSKQHRPPVITSITPFQNLHTSQNIHTKHTQRLAKPSRPLVSPIHSKSCPFSKLLPKILAS